MGRICEFICISGLIFLAVMANCIQDNNLRQKLRRVEGTYLCAQFSEF